MQHLHQIQKQMPLPMQQIQQPFPQQMQQPVQKQMKQPVQQQIQSLLHFNGGEFKLSPLCHLQHKQVQWGMVRTLAPLCQPKSKRLHSHCLTQVTGALLRLLCGTTLHLNPIIMLSADDTQIYLAVDSRNFDSSMEELTECLKSVQEWMDGVKLKLNPEKNEFIIIGQKAIRELLAPNFPVPLLQNNISQSVEVKNLGVIFDSDNSFDNHVAKVCRACYYHLRDLRRIRKFLGVETAILLANAMVSSRLDYCNSLL